MVDYDFEKLNRVIEEQEVTPNSDENNDYMSQQGENLVYAIIGGLLSSVLIASLWALITVNAQKQWMVMGIFAGMAVGYVVHFMGKGRTIPISVIGGLFALLSCVLGDYLTNVGFIAQEEGLAYFETLSMIDNTFFFEIAFADFDFFSLIVYGIAAYAGFQICYKTDS